MMEFNHKKNVFIISNRSKEIAEAIINRLGRGATYIDGEGAYTHETRKVIFCVVKLTQVARLKDLVSQLDPDAFMIVQDARDVMGEGLYPGKRTTTSSGPLICSNLVGEYALI